MAVAQAETGRLKAAAARAAAEKTSLEQAADELEAKCRAAIAAEEDSRYLLYIGRTLAVVFRCRAMLRLYVSSMHTPYVREI